MAANNSESLVVTPPPPHHTPDTVSRSSFRLTLMVSFSVVEAREAASPSE